MPNVSACLLQLSGPFPLGRGIDGRDARSEVQENPEMPNASACLLLLSGPLPLGRGIDSRDALRPLH